MKEKLFDTAISFGSMISPGVRVSRVVIELEDGSRFELPVPTNYVSTFRHSDDYRTVIWHGRQFTFSPTKAIVIQLLHEANLAGMPDVSGQVLIEKAESNSNRISDLFRDDPAWNVLVVSGKDKGTYRLSLEN